MEVMVNSQLSILNVKDNIINKKLSPREESNQ